MTRFILGLVVGAAAFAIGERFIHPAHQTSDAREPIPLADTRHEEQALDAPPETSGPEIASVAIDRRARVPEQAHAISATSDGDTAVSVQPGSAEDEECACRDVWFTRKMQREKAAREAEPKDGQWAYSMEQLLQQFAATHRQGSKFEIASIDCRTTFCEIKAIGRTEGAYEAFQQVMHEAQQQPWSQFSLEMASSSGDADDGTRSLMFRLKRR